MMGACTIAKDSKIWWMRYRDKNGVRRRESTFTEDWTEAQKCLRERLQARDNHTLPALRRVQDLTFGEWSDFYLENFSRPPFRAPKTHEIDERALKHLRKMFEDTKLAEGIASVASHVECGGPQEVPVCESMFRR